MVPYSWKPQEEHGVNKSIKGWKELASLLNCKEGAAVEDGGQTQLLSCGYVDTCNFAL